MAQYTPVKSYQSQGAPLYTETQLEKVIPHYGGAGYMTLPCSGSWSSPLICSTGAPSWSRQKPR